MNDALVIIPLREGYPDQGNVVHQTMRALMADGCHGRIIRFKGNNATVEHAKRGSIINTTQFEIHRHVYRP